MIQQSKTNWKAIVFYVAAATIIAGLFRKPFFDFYNSSSYHFMVALACVTLLIGWAPALSAFLSWKIFGSQNRESDWFGAWKNGALAMASLPAIVFGAFGYPNDFGMNAHLAGFLLGALIFLYALGEEIGWRGYMQDALAPRPLWIRALLIGVVWWAWHLFFFRSLDPGYILQSLAIIFGTSFMLSWLISESRSWISVAAFHSIGNIAFMATALDMPQQTRFTIAGIIFVGLLAIHLRWKKRFRS